MTSESSAHIIDTILARVLPVVRAHASEGEQLRRLPAPTAEALISAGAFLAQVPASLGGFECAPAEVARMVEEISKVDGGTGFVVGNINSQAYSMLALPVEGAREVFADKRAVIVGGAFPPARAEVVPGGYRITGQAPFSSGAHMATWVTAFSMVVENGAPVIGPHGMPNMVLAVLRREDCELLDTWNTMGLRSSGSHDFKYTNVFVPTARAGVLSLGNPNDLFSGPVFRARLWSGHPAFAVTALGVARAALDEVTALALRKTPNFMAKKVAESQSVQRLLGRAEARWRAAHSYIYETIEELWKHQLTGEFVTNAHAIDMQLAACFAIESSREVSEMVHEIAGSTGFQEASPLEQLFRDAHTMSQHAFASAARFESAAKAILGFENDWAFFKL
ncbi:MAG: hypothetical protein IPI49_22655 [Myxococcales bacterium]|nr:hypothetical protein [Myxococcales bacterium]HRC57799.1 acyl-CoA dehydrogenase family protein [Kofleriaceae bacterium]